MTSLIQGREYPTTARLNRSQIQETPANREELNQAHNSLYRVPDSSLRVPEVSLELIQYLNLQFPDQLRLVQQLGTVDAAKGARTVIEHLIELYQEQQEIPHVLRRQVLSAARPDGSGPTA